MKLARRCGRPSPWPLPSAPLERRSSARNSSSNSIDFTLAQGIERIVCRSRISTEKFRNEKYGITRFVCFARGNTMRRVLCAHLLSCLFIAADPRSPVSPPVQPTMAPDALNQCLSNCVCAFELVFRIPPFRPLLPLLSNVISFQKNCQSQECPEITHFARDN